MFDAHIIPDSFSIEGHAIVSADGMIADASGEMPPGLVNPADFALFQASLDRADVVVLGRLGHVRHPNRNRRRLVFTRSVELHAIDPADPLATLYNPGREALADVLGAMGFSRGRLAVPGGREIFDWFAPRFDAFQLSEVHDLVLPGGIPCFSGGHPRAVLATNGLVPGRMERIDAEAGVTLTEWTRPA